MGTVQCSCQSGPRERAAEDKENEAVAIVPVLGDNEPVAGVQLPNAVPPSAEREPSPESSEPGDPDPSPESSDTEDVCNDTSELAEAVENTELELMGKACDLTKDDKTVGDHVCERAQDESCVKAFQEEDKLTRLLKIVEERVLLDHAGDAAKDEVLASLHGTKGTTTLAYAVSDPSVPDCPLMYVSSGFENATGYSVDFSTGRSCRFLQPTNKILNDAVNLNDRKLMREFCKEPLPEGTSLVNLLVNERYDGLRFWNLLKMEHVCVDGKIYIFAVQSVVDTYMPKLLRKRLKDTATDKKNQQVVDELAKFLKRLKVLRAEIVASKDPISKLTNHVQSRLNEIKAKSEKAAAKKLPKDKPHRRSRVESKA